MKALRIWSIVMCVLVLLFVLMDIYGFFYALYPSYGDYPILPFGAKPYYARVLNDTGRYVMEPIIEADEYSEKEQYAFISDRVQKSSALDSLQIVSIVQYSWKKDSLLLEVILANKSVKWLLASPAISTDANYICQLQEIEVPTKEQLSSCHQIRLIDKPHPLVLMIRRWANKLDDDTLMYASLFIILGLLLLLMLVPLLNLICLILWRKHRTEWRAEPSVLKRSLYILALLFPLIVYITINLLSWYTTFAG